MTNKTLKQYILLLSISACLTEVTQALEYNIIDKAHGIISNEVVYYTNYLDEEISDWLNTSPQKDQCKPMKLTRKSDKHIDSFFQNTKYLDETKDTYIRVRFKNYFYSDKDYKISVRVNAQLPFDRCKEEWKLFIQDNSLTDNKKYVTQEGQNLGAGLRYYKKNDYGIKSSFAVGIQRKYPFIRGRFHRPIKKDDWHIDPVQIFKYSHKYYFEEESNIYFDKHINNGNMFRLKLHRKTKFLTKGMDYGLSTSYYSNTKKQGWRVTQSFFGNTKYSPVYARDKEYAGIHNYETSFSWRSNMYKNWLYYEVQPTISFHKDYRYSPNYALRFVIDIYFGAVK